MTAIPPQTTIAEERAGLNERRAQLMQRRGEVAKLLRNERVDAQERRELQEEQVELTAKIRAVENELSTLDDAEQSESQDRRAAALAAEDERRKQAADRARAALGEYESRTGVLENFIALAAQEAKALLALEADIRRQGYSAIRTADGRDAFAMACTPLLAEREISELLAEVSKGRLRPDLAFTSRVTRRVNEALAMLGRMA